VLVTQKSTTTLTATQTATFTVFVPTTTTQTTTTTATLEATLTNLGTTTSTYTTTNTAYTLLTDVQPATFTVATPTTTTQTVTSTNTIEATSTNIATTSATTTVTTSTITNTNTFTQFATSTYFTPTTTTTTSTLVLPRETLLPGYIKIIDDRYPDPSLSLPPDSTTGQYFYSAGSAYNLQVTGNRGSVAALRFRYDYNNGRIMAFEQDYLLQLPSYDILATYPPSYFNGNIILFSFTIVRVALVWFLCLDQLPYRIPIVEF
jgi:hypothetical protein